MPVGPKAHFASNSNFFMGLLLSDICCLVICLTVLQVVSAEKSIPNSSLGSWVSGLWSLVSGIGCLVEVEAEVEVCLVNLMHYVRHFQCRERV